MEFLYRKNNSFCRSVMLVGLLFVMITVAAALSACSKTGLSIAKPVPSRSLNECVVLIHGMGRTLHSMDKMQERLVAEGYHTVSLGYPSTRATIEEIVSDYFPEALKQCQQFSPDAVHFVSHSLGGIVLRAHFKAAKPENMGRVVMLSPPNKGSEAADSLKDWWLYKWINGPAGQQLTTDLNSFPNRLGPVDYPVGIITGDRYIFFDYWLSTIIPGRDDGKVSVARSRLEGMRDFLVVHETHPFIMDDEYVQDETVYFLQNGSFMHKMSPPPPVTGHDWFSFPSKE